MKRKPAPARGARVALGPRYRVVAADLNAHVYEVELLIAAPDTKQRVSLPAWIPGSYLLRDFARHLHRLSARQGDAVVEPVAIDTSTWELQCVAGQALTLSYRIYAFDASLRAAHLDPHRGFFNGTSLFLRVHGQEDQPHRLELPKQCFPKDWKLATGLPAHRIDAKGFGLYETIDYDELVDAPAELGPFWDARFDVRGVPHRLVISGAAAGFDGERLVADITRICETQIRMWHGRAAPPHSDYTFLLHVVDKGYGGLEHRNSTALLASRADLPRVGDERRSDAYITLLSLISHEYFHTWNVKRLRPRALVRLDYSRAQDTRMLWFAEGFTAYYDELMLRRAGLIDDAAYLRLLGKTWNALLQTPGRRVQSVEQAGADAWIKHYRPDEGTSNLTVSYYTKGALVALCLDLRLRAAGSSLDLVMRWLWKHCAASGMERTDLTRAVRACAALELDAELDAWVAGTDELPVETLLREHGVDIRHESASLAQRLGLRMNEARPLVINVVSAGSAAQAAGLSPHDELMAVEVGGLTWQLGRLDDLAVYASQQLDAASGLESAAGARSTTLRLWVARDRRVLAIDLPTPLPRSLIQRLSVYDTGTVHRWLNGN